MSTDSPTTPQDQQTPADSEQPSAGASGDNSPEVPKTTEQATTTASDTAAAHAAPSATESTGQAADANDPPAASARPKIQVGSRRGGEKIKSSKPVMAKQDKPVAEEAKQAAEAVKSIVEEAPPPPPPKPAERVQPPSKRDPLSPELEQELNAAIGDLSLDQIASGSAVDASQPLDEEARQMATVARMHGDNVFFSLGGRNEGACSVRQFLEPPSVGDEVEVVVRNFNVDDGLYEVGVPGQSVEVGDWSDLTEGAIVEVRITGANTGGLEGMVNAIRGFIPSSQIQIFRVENLAEFVGQKLLCVVTEANKRRKNLVLSHRALLERQREEERKKVLEEINAGDVREGIVRSLRDFGAFVDLGGVDGLVHISQLSWDRVNHPSEVLQEGQKVRVKVEKVNKESGKISLTYRDLLDHPWTDVQSRFPGGATVKGTVSRAAKFGAFVRLAPGVEGLIHISELAHHRVRSVEEIVKEGQEVEVKIVSVDEEAQRIALSLKATLPEPEKPAEPEQPPTERVVRKSNKPLKGGLGGPSGGEQFGLNW